MVPHPLNILIVRISDIFTMKTLLLALLVCAVLLALSEAAGVSFKTIKVLNIDLHV